MAENLTPWFPATVTPVREGIYHRFNDIHNNGAFYSYWNGRFWGTLCTSKEAALIHKDMRTKLPEEEWRGLASEPTNDHGK